MDADQPIGSVEKAKGLLPHEREQNFLDDIIDDCLHGRNKLVWVATENQNQLIWFAREATHIAENLEPNQSKHIKIFREALEFDNGAKILFMNVLYPSSFRGMSPDRIVLMGKWGEFWYLLLGTGCTRIEAVG